MPDCTGLFSFRCMLVGLISSMMMSAEHRPFPRTAQATNKCVGVVGGLMAISTVMP